MKINFVRLQRQIEFFSSCKIKFLEQFPELKLDRQILFEINYWITLKMSKNWSRPKIIDLFFFNWKKFIIELGVLWVTSWGVIKLFFFERDIVHLVRRAPRHSPAQRDESENLDDLLPDGNLGTEARSPLETFAKSRLCT